MARTESQFRGVLRRRGKDKGSLVQTWDFGAPLLLIHPFPDFTPNCWVTQASLSALWAGILVFQT